MNDTTQVSNLIKISAPRNSIIFAAFSGHHNTLAGAATFSKWYFNWFVRERDPQRFEFGQKIKVNVNIDVSAGSPILYFVAEDNEFRYFGGDTIWLGVYGSVREYIDAVRFISNPSSGKMGISLAIASIQRGAEVTLVYGPGTVEPPPLTKVVNVESTREMLDAVVTRLKKEHYDIMISTAAVSDYGPEMKINAKTPSGKKDFTVRFVPLPKVIDTARKVAPDIFLVGFKAEYNVPKEQLISCALNKIRKANLDLIVANDISQEGAGFASNNNEVYVIDRSGEVTHIPLSPKRVVASRILDIVVKKYREKIRELQKSSPSPKIDRE